MHRTEWSAALAFFSLGLARAMAERASLVARLAFFILLLSVFWSIWSATPLGELKTGELKTGVTAAQILWYFMINECIALAPGATVRAVEDDIRSGEIAGGLSRPLPYGLASVAEWLGGALFRALVLAAVGVPYAAVLTGEIAIAASAVLPLVLAVAISCVLVVLFHLQLGYVAAWAGLSTPAYWIWQKFLFLAGGMILPLMLYPSPLRDIAELSPFAAILFAPASLVFDSSPARIAEVLGLQLFWLPVTLLLTVAVDRAATRRFLTRGV
jgi:ABC-2 type transport system permease protein